MLLFLQKIIFSFMNQVFSLIEWIILDENQKILYNNKVKVLQLIHMGEMGGYKNARSNYLGNARQLIMLRILFCRVRNFLKKYYVIFEQQINLQKIVHFHLKMYNFFFLGYLLNKNNKRGLPFTEGFFC